MPERDGVRCELGDGYRLVALGIRRERSGDLTADLILERGGILFAERAVVNTTAGSHAWAEGAQQENGPTAARLAEALQDYVLPDALRLLQDEPKKPTQADLLVGLVREQRGEGASDLAPGVELFQDARGQAFATLPVGEHRETWPLASKGFRQWLARQYYERAGKIPGSQALTDAIGVLSGQALFAGPEYPVFLRLASHDGVVYLDLGNAAWEVVAIDSAGWRIVTDPPVKFRRGRGMLPLPHPVPGGKLEGLRRFLNLPIDPAGWILIVSWLLATFRPTGPYPVLVVLGEQGAAKSTLLRMLRALIDPYQAPIRSLPRDERDLMIAATNSWCLCFDNLSHLADWQSDALCRISTGGGFAVRELYTDLDETILDVQRPLALNGIEEVVTRNDLLDRSLLVVLPTITSDHRQPERQLWQEFERARPALLGAMLDAVSTALANEGTTTLLGHPRMADFAVWIVAAEPTLPWEQGAFLAAYQGNQAEANDLTLEASPVAQALGQFMSDGRTTWVGTATELLGELETLTDEKTRRQKTWPASARVLANALRRLAPNLRGTGIDLTFGRANGGKRVIGLEQTRNSSSSSSPASLNSAVSSLFDDDDDANGDAGDAERRDREAIHRHQQDTSSLEDPPEMTGWWENDSGGDAGDDEMETWTDWAAPSDVFAVEGEAGDDRWTR